MGDPRAARGHAQWVTTLRSTAKVALGPWNPEPVPMPTLPTVSSPLGALFLLLAASACQSPPPVPDAVSMDGRALTAPALGQSRVDWLDLEIKAAMAKWRLNPSEQNAIWVGRRLAYRGLYADAIGWYLGALETFPESYRLRRHLAHRLLTLRGVDAAIQELNIARALAAQQPNRLEPDGAPGPSGEPRSTTHGNIAYHLALGHYLRGEFSDADRLWQECMERWARNEDSRVAAHYWRILCHVQDGRQAELEALLKVPIDESDVIENFDYLDLVRLFRGKIDRAALLARDGRSAALDYGIARHMIAEGETEAGQALLDDLLQREGWMAFGVLAAEADVSRLQGLPPSP